MSKLLGRRSTRTRLGRGEDGYILAMFALLLVSLLAFAGFGVDIGAWYSRGQQIQRAVDAAALAGVVYLPADFPQAQTVACSTLKKNGIDCADTSKFDVNITLVGNRQLQVTARDKHVKTYFSKVFLDEMPNGIRRTSTAEYIMPVPLGSPESRFGTGNLSWSGLTLNQFWGAVSPFCTAKEFGDQISSWTDGQGWGTCPPPHGSGSSGDTAPQPTYSAEGYSYYIDVAAGNPAIEVRVYDPGYCQDISGQPGDYAGYLSGSTWTWTTFNTEYRLYSADSTPLDDTDNPQFGTTYISPASDSCDAWKVLFTIPAATTAGQWRLNIRTPAPPSASLSTGTNAWGIWAKRPVDTTPCSAISTPGCPRVYAKDRMSIVVNSPASTATFYLAEVDPIHVGKTLEIELWDPGDGMSDLRILNPLGVAQPFQWRTSGESNDYPWQNNNTCSGQPCLNVGGGTGFPTPSNKPGRVDTHKFNDRLVTIKLTLPNSFTSFPNYWWQIRYAAPSGSLYDRTTWAAEVKGDPVHLINE